MPLLKEITDQVFEFFASVRLALVLLFVLAVAAIGGTILPQGLPPEDYLQRLGPELYTFLGYLGMFDLYDSAWFRFLLMLLVVNLVICSIKRLPATIRLARPINPERIGVDFLARQPFHTSLIWPVTADNALPEVTKIISRSFGPPKEQSLGWGRLLVADRGRFSRFGVYVVHVSLLFILAGGLVGFLWGISGFMRLHEGETLGEIFGEKPQGLISLPFSVRLDRFEVTYYPNGTPSEYRSDVTVMEHGKEIRKASIRVNHPLRHRGMVFYQSSLGQTPVGEIALKLVRSRDEQPFEVKLRPGRMASLPDGDGMIQLMDMHDDVMGAGPAVRIVIRPKNGSPYVVWAFKERPPFLPPPSEPYWATLTELNLRYWTGLQVRRDPGVFLVWMGCALMLIGFVVTFFFSHRKLFVGLIPEGQSTRLFLAGSAHRNKGAYKILFDLMASRLEYPDNLETNS